MRLVDVTHECSLRKMVDSDRYALVHYVPCGWNNVGALPNMYRYFVNEHGDFIVELLDKQE